RSGRCRCKCSSSRRSKRCRSCRRKCRGRRRRRCRRSRRRWRRNVAVNESGALIYPGRSGAERTLNIVNPIKGYQGGVCSERALLTHEEKVATQPCEVAQRISPGELEHLLFLVEERKVVVWGCEVSTVEAARRVRDNVNAFRGNVTEKI